MLSSACKRCIVCGCDLQPVQVQQSSPTEAPALAKRLREAGAKMYGAFWCTHCHDQKEDFGREAMADFPYVECYPDGVKNVSPHTAIQSYKQKQLPAHLCASIQ